MRILLTLCLILCSLQSIFCAAKNNIKTTVGFSISEEEAIRKAEEFIALNGYTDFPPTEDSLKITLESIEWTSNYNELLKSRYDTLERKAFGILKTSNEWIVVFRYKKDTEHSAGRAVTMSLSGSKLRVEHQDFRLNAVQKKLEYDLLQGAQNY